MDYFSRQFFFFFMLFVCSNAIVMPCFAQKIKMDVTQSRDKENIDITVLGVPNKDLKKVEIFMIEGVKKDKPQKSKEKIGKKNNTAFKYRKIDSELNKLNPIQIIARDADAVWGSYVAILKKDTIARGIGCIGKDYCICEGKCKDEKKIFADNTPATRLIFVDIGTPEDSAANKQKGFALSKSNGITKQNRFYKYFDAKTLVKDSLYQYLNTKVDANSILVITTHDLYVNKPIDEAKLHSTLRDKKCTRLVYITNNSDSPNTAGVNDKSAEVNKLLQQKGFISIVTQKEYSRTIAQILDDLGTTEQTTWQGFKLEQEQQKNIRIIIK